MKLTFFQFTKKKLRRVTNVWGVQLRSFCLFILTISKIHLRQNLNKIDRFREIVVKALVQKRLKMAWRSQGTTQADLIMQLKGKWTELSLIPIINLFTFRTRRSKKWNGCESHDWDWSKALLSSIQSICRPTLFNWLFCNHFSSTHALLLSWTPPRSFA